MQGKTISPRPPRTGRLVATVSGALFLVLAAPGAAVVPRTEDVVRAWAAVEKLRDLDRNGGAEASAAFEKRYPTAAFEKLVERHQTKAAILEQRWGTVISDRELQAELDRMARETRRPDRLRRLFEALDDDPELIAEVLARPSLVDRRLRALFAAGAGARANGSFDAWLAEQRPVVSTKPLRADRTAGLALPKILGSGTDEPDSWTVELPAGPPAKKGQSAVWTGSEVIVWGGATPGPPSSGLWTNAGFSYDPTTDTWSPIRLDSTTPEPRAFHSAVWTGTSMIVWGGESWDDDATPPYYVALDTGGVYDPVDDTWVATPATGAPGARLEHVGVWTGSAMLVWGGLTPDAPVGPPADVPDYTPMNDGAIFEPAFGGWTSMGGSPPSARGRAAAVWTGDAMWVIGGWDGTNWLSPGAGMFSGYDPAADSWAGMPPPPGATPYEGLRAVWTGQSLWVAQPSSGKLLANYDGASWSQPVAMPPAPMDRRYASLVWTGRRLLLWGGVTGADVALGDGVIYDTRNDTWTTIPIDPGVSSEPRFEHFGTWLGAEMLVWGGGSTADPAGPSRPLTTVSTGDRFQPAWDGPNDSGTWTALPKPPIAAARGHSMVWTGSELIVWGGELGNPVQSGIVYDPILDVWSATTETGAPAARVGHTAVWTGSEMVVWGGRDASSLVMDTGGLYDPATDSWTATGGTPPAARVDHTAVWTGSEMLVWGGFDDAGFGLDSGALYGPGSDTWTATGGTAPSARGEHAAVWTGDEMVIFGGLVSCPTTCTPTNDAATYDPVLDQWSASFTNSADDGERWGHSAVWTGQEMIVWGGTGTYTDTNACLDDGLSIDPAGTITTLSPFGDTRCRHSAIWNGEEMIVWGGTDRINNLLTGGVPPEMSRSSGGRFEPATTTWTATPDDETTIPGTQLHTAVWSGEEMLIWGGRPEISGSLGVYYTDTLPTSSPDLEIDGVPGTTVLLGGAAETITLGHTLPAATFDDVEGAEQWTATGLWHVTVAGTCADQGDYYSPFQAWRFGEPGACHYQGSAGTYTLTSGTFEITSATLLDLRTFLETDRVGDASEQDSAYIEASADNGSSWTTVAIDLTNWTDSGSPPPVPLDDTGDTWRGLSLGLADYIGTTTTGRVRFVFERNGSLNFATGWIVDDIGLGEPAGDGRIPAGTLVAKDGSAASHRVESHDLWDRPSFSWDLNADGVADNSDTSVPAFEITENDLAAYGLDYPGQYSLELTVTDRNGQTDAQTVTLDVVDGEPPTVEVLSPNGGEAWSAGSTQVISWSAADNIGLGGFDLAYYDDEAGTGPTAIACAEAIDGDSRSCTWNLPATTSTAVRVEIIASDQRPAPGGPNTATDTSDAPFYVVQANSDEIRTLILWHRSRIEALYSAAEADDLAADLATFASHVKVDGQVLDLTNVPSLDPLYAAWDGTAWATGTLADLDDNITQANALAAAIRTYLFEQVSSSFTNLEFLVLVGGDSSIPFWRVAEDLPRYPESNYIAELQGFGFLDDGSSLAAFCDETESPTLTAFCRDSYLADTPYGTSQTTDVPGSSFTWYLPDLAVGRMVETPAQISGLIDSFVAQDGVTVVDRALTAGYDFLTDGGDAVHSLLEAELDLGATTVDRLSEAVSSWTDSDLLGRLFGVDPTEPSDLTFIDGHADHRAEGAAAAGDAGVLTTLEMQAAGTTNRGGVVIGVGCHSGVPIEPDGGAGDELDPAYLLDLPEILAESSFPVLIGNGGYGWGLSEGVGLGEQLVLLVAEEIVGAGQVAVGEALRRAKREYFLRQDRLDAFDHKVLQEAMLLGIPNYEVRVHLPVASASLAGLDAVRFRGERSSDRPWLADPEWSRLDLGSGRSLSKTAARNVVSETVGLKAGSSLRILDFTYTAFEKGQDTDSDPGTADWQEAYVQFDWCTDAGGESILCTGGGGETDVGTFFTLDGLATSEAGRPIQPMISFDSHLFGTELHGILIRGGEYLQPTAINPSDAASCTDVDGTVHPCFDPVVGNPETEVEEAEGPAPTPFISIDVPTPFISIDVPTPNGFEETGASGNDGVRFDTLNAPMGAAVRRGVREVSPGVREEIYSEWLYRTRDFTNYYSSSSDWTAPVVGAFTADCLAELPGDDCFHTLADQTVSFDVPVTDAGDGVYKVFVTYTQDVDAAGDGAWVTLELTPIGGDHFTGSVQVVRDGSYLVQAVDWAGNIGTVTVSGDDVDDSGLAIGSTYELPRLFPIVTGGLVFADGFEGGSTSAWSSKVP